MTPGLSTACLLISALVLAPQDKVDDAKLDRAWKTWVRYMDRGRLPPTTKNWQRRAAILPAEMRLVSESRWSQYTRLDEARDLVTLLVLRGTYKDGQRILGHILGRPTPKRPDSHDWFVKLQKHVIDELDRADLPVGIQAALIDRLEEGAVQMRRGSSGLSHSDPALASMLIPLLGSFHRSRFRPILERYLASGDGRLILAATKGLCRMKSGGVIGKVLLALPSVKTVTRRRDLVRLLLELDAQEPERSESEQSLLEKRWLGLLHQEMRRLEDPMRKAPLLPLFRTWRQPESVPRLIDELVATIEISKKPKAPTSLVFYQNDLHEALMNLTGTYVRRGEWEQWPLFWKREGENFILAKEPRRGHVKTSASGFFGLPVRGKRVVFILDTSGSMSASTGGRGLRAFGEGHTRLARAKKELLSAVNGMSKTSSFNVIFFSSDARRWLPGPRSANSKRKKALETALRSIKPDGGTDLLDALKLGMRGQIHATTGLVRTSVDEIFILSDGMPSNPADYILERVSKWNKGRAAVINTVYLGIARPTSPTTTPLPLFGPAAFMKRLAEENGGKFVAVD